MRNCFFTIMFNKLSTFRAFPLMLQGFILGLAYFLAPNVLANPLESNINKLSDAPTLRIPEKSTFTDEVIPKMPQLNSLKDPVIEPIEVTETKSLSPCPIFTPLNNIVQPNISPNEDKNNENKVKPTSFCSADLIEIKNSKEEFEKQIESSLITEKSIPESSSNSSSQLEELKAEELKAEEIKTVTVADDERWHFKLQPYATIPINTYGTVSARGQTVSYHLSLGELLDTLRATASGRFEGWKGRWGFIVDGYFASLQDIGNLQISRSRTPNPINALNFLLNSGINTKLQEVVNVVDREIEAANNIKEVRDAQPFQDLRRQFQDFQAIVSQDAKDIRELELRLQEFQDAVITGRQNIEVLEIRVEDLQNLESEIDILEDLTINNINNINTQRLERIISLSVQDLPLIDNLQDLNNQIQQLNRLTDLNQLGQQLRQTRDNLETVSQQVQELRAKQDSEALQNLESKLEEAKALLDREVQVIDQIQEFVANQETQQLNADIGASLQFDQGIYDFAISYHIGDLPAHELPEQPSNRNFPLIWFQPIAGVRLNDISIEIETINNFEISSSLVNIEGTVQRNFRRDRTWFEPMLGGKFGIQISDPMTFWLRGDASGFGLAGETDISWNLLFGVDWWVHRQISLQLGYHFYEIDYKTGNDNDFGFEENLNGPFLSATFHF
jgi:hypothetical protein